MKRALILGVLLLAGCGAKQDFASCELDAIKNHIDGYTGNGGLIQSNIYLRTCMESKGWKYRSGDSLTVQLCDIAVTEHCFVYGFVFWDDIKL